MKLPSSEGKSNPRNRTKALTQKRRIFRKEHIVPASQAIKEMQIKTTMRTHFILVRSPKTRMLKNARCRLRYGTEEHICRCIDSYIYSKEESGSF